MNRSVAQAQQMQFLALIVSTFPWFPNPLSPFVLFLLAMCALWSRAVLVASVALLVGFQELRVANDTALTPKQIPTDQTCAGILKIERVMTQVTGYSSASATLIQSDCQAFNAGTRFKIIVNGFQELMAGERRQATFRVTNLRGFANPGGFDATRFALSEDWIGKAVIQHITPPLDSNGLRGTVREQLTAWPDPIKGLALALLFGEKHALDEVLYRVFGWLGLSHVLSISGLHVGIVLGGVWWITRRGMRSASPASRARVAAGLVSAVACALAIWTLWTPSVTRAASMAVLLAWLPVFGMRPRLLTVLALAVCLIAIWDPWMTLSTGFLMSSGALVIIGSVIWANPGSGLGQILRLQVAFSLLMAPALSFWLGFDYPWLGLLANLILVPLLPLLLGVLVILLVFDIPRALDVVNRGLLIATETVEWMMSQTLFAQIPDPWILCGMMVCALWVVMPKYWPRPLIIAIGLMWVSAPDEPKPLFRMLDVGQGSMALLDLPNHRVLFDLGAGMPDRWSRIGQLQEARQFDGIQGVHISHGDMDHVGGLFDLLNTPIVPEWIEGGGSVSTLAMPCVPQREIDGVVVQTLWPSSERSGTENHRSCVQLIQSENVAILLMGDADWVAESFVIRELRERELLGQIDIVVTSHHGANDGSNPSFVTLVGARHALISVGASNRYGHPHADVIDRWEGVGASIHRTDRDGAITVDLQTGEVRRYRQVNPTRWTHSVDPA